MNCPKCDAEMEHQEAEPDVGILSGGYYCHACDEAFPDHDFDDEPFDPGWRA